ncbi:adenylate kinase [Sporothrix brasiliensis 5110]|uniref:GTP:AMP phosphotransferase, mitochondrial n=1 Tax=Sporothrix brasiliensis 5110 TaxID=1398154 RepID=A0A0C2FBX8_9PEZI|nr:adenylate kinase [Sporothrix brasiliensis 5110]KIH88588.1 adenylate kinase [Sporothrix brasiliensis 5110]
MRIQKAARVILVGAPGVGKGTQSERLLGRFPQLAHLSSGDLLRHNVKTRTPLGIKVESTMKAGGLVSDDLILRLIRNELSSRGWLTHNGRPPVITLASAGLSSGADPETVADSEAGVAAFLSQQSTPDPTTSTVASSSSASTTGLSDDPSASFLLDGFPRTASQAAQLDTFVPINLVVSLKTPFSVMLARISGRWVHEPSGRVYNETFNAPKVPGRDDVTGEPLVRRADDSEAVYRARFNKFEETSAPLLDHYARQGVLWEVEGMTSDEITPKLVAEFERRFCTSQDC